MERTAPLEHRRNYDVDCLRCGARNIPENRICGKCGASLPLVYDSGGRLHDPKELSKRWETVKRATPAGEAVSTFVRWVLRVGVILLALLLAFWILRH